MNEFKSAKAKPWNNMYSSSSSSNNLNKEGGPWKSLQGSSSTNAISFGFVATAILISMFLIMAIFEHLFRPSHQDSSMPTQMHKLQTPPQLVQISYAADLSVVMPGQQHPIFIAQLAPLPREGTLSNSHSISTQ